MAFLPPLIYLLSGLNFYVWDRPMVGNFVKFVLVHNLKDGGIGGGRWRDPVWVTTSQGRMKGSREFSRTGKTFYWFRGIPYSSPRTGEYRYEPPEPHHGWDGELDATKYGSECLHINFFTRKVSGSENCLFLNVATRKNNDNSNGSIKRKQDLYPVLFFIHGGLFMFGQADTFGPKYFMDEEVVLVSLNYRLNSFGFLNTGDGVVQGNMGLKDQVQALHWVQEHIHHFNGDKKRVTLIGESAGASCVHLHTLSPLSRDLFSGAISLSGTALAPWAHIDNPEEQSKEFGDGLGCPSSEGSAKMVQCLKEKDAETIASYHKGALVAAAYGKSSLFAPTVDSGTENLFLPATPLDLLRSGNISNRPWISGVNSGDGLVYLIAVLRNESMRQHVNRQWENLAPRVLSYDYLENKQTVTKDLTEYYLDNKELSHDNIPEANTLMSDRGFFLDSHDAGVMQSQVAPTYLFYYTYEGVFNGGNMLFTRAKLPLPSDYQYIFGSAMVWMNSMITNKRQKSKFGVCHGDEMPLLFNVPPLLRREVYPGDADYEFSRKMVGLWVSFANDGIPDTTRAGVQWDPINVPLNSTSSGSRSAGGDISLRRLHLDEKLVIIDEPFYGRLQFWRNHSISYLPTT